MNHEVLQDLGVLLVRVPAGLLLMGHGLQKLFGWFGGDGIRGTGQAFAGLGYTKGAAMAVVAGLTEVAAGAGLVLGLLTPLAAAGAIGIMINAIVTVHAANGPWAQNGGYEYPLVIATLAAGLALAGPGGISIDGLLGIAEPTAVLGIGAIVLGVLSSAGALGMRRTTARTTAEPV